ncbi:MAG TPA: FHA domain-containing protein [Leptolyngbyaceae cyanobacterium M65_K2018_010]|nr:FHA domain-containing protein [Leptolyngbyaceae cyanobacterium M65_K2018_010]
MITLSLLHPLHKTLVQSWSFDQEPMIRIGRSSDNHVILYSAVVSRYHVEIHRQDAGWTIKSLGTNGTYLNGKRIVETPVEDGMVIRLARSGPNIQINTTEEQRDPLQDLLLNSQQREEGTFVDGQPEDSPPATSPNQTTLINS